MTDLIAITSEWNNPTKCGENPWRPVVREMTWLEFDDENKAYKRRKWMDVARPGDVLIDGGVYCAVGRSVEPNSVVAVGMEPHVTRLPGERLCVAPKVTAFNFANDLPGRDRPPRGGYAIIENMVVINWRIGDVTQ